MNSTIVNQTSVLQIVPGTESLIIPACGEMRNFSESTSLFPGGTDSDFQEWNIDGVQDDPTPQMVTSVWELIRDANFEEMLNSLDRNLIDNFLTKTQAITWLELYPEHRHPQGWATFLPLKVKRERDKYDFFVAGALLYGSGLRAGVRRFEYGDHWGAESRRRLVLPQLVPLVPA